MSKKTYQTPTGMHDVLPFDQAYFKRINEAIEKVAGFYGFEKIDTPILEDAELFIRSVGEGTDIVEKEMYVLKTKGRDILALRPEGTAGIVRAYIQHGLQTIPQPVKFWYFGPFFRYEKPQQGRFRQFWQFGIETLGEKNPVIDAQIILASYNILEELGLKNLIVDINSVGCIECRKEYKKALSIFLRNRKNKLCGDCKKRMKTNILRVLDCKNEKCQQVLEETPQILEYLCPDCHKDLKEVLEYLDELKLPYNLNPFLVRGLDYYNKTVFEIKTKESDSLAGGGRYDILGKILRGEDIPAVGTGFGVERIIALMKKNKIRVREQSQTKVFLAQIGSLAKKKSICLLEEFRKNKIAIAESLGKDSLKSQLTKADKLGIKLVLMLGQKEAVSDTVILRDMATGKQSVVKYENIIKEVKKRIK